MSFHLFRTWSIKFRVSLFVLLIFTGSTWSLVGYASRILHDHIGQLVGGQQLSTATFMAAEINEQLQIRVTSLEKISSEITPALAGNPASLQAYLENLPLAEVLFNRGLFFTGRDGTVTADVPLSAGRIGINYLDRTSISIPLTEGKSVIGPPALGKALAAPLFSISVPVRGPGGVIGVLVGTITLNHSSFLDMVSDNRYGRTGGYLLVERQHRLIITATEKSRILTPLPAPGVNRLLDRYIGGFEGSGVAVNSRGVNELTAARRIPCADWIILVKVPTEEAFAPIREMQQHLFQAGILLTLFSCGLTWWILRRQLVPLFDTIERLAAMSASGNLLNPLQVTTKDEIGGLIGGFNRLLESLKRREETLTERTSELSIILENAPIAIMKFIDRRQVLVNRKAVDLFGYTQEELEFQTLWKLCPSEDDYEKLFHEADQVLAAGRVLESEQELTRKDGVRITVRFIGKAVEPLDPSKGLIWLMEDITERRKTETEREQYHRFFLTSADLLVILDSAGGILKANPAWTETLGYAASEFVGRSFLTWVDPQDLQATIDEMSRQQRLGPSYCVENRYLRKDGSQLWLSWRGVTDAAEGVTYAIARNITQLKQAESALLEKSNLLHNVINSSEDCIYVKDSELRIILCNEVFATFLRHPPEALYGKTDIENGVEPELVKGNLARGIRGFEQDDLEALGGQRVHRSTDRRTAEGEIRNFDSIKVPLKDQNGAILGLVGISRDITRLKQTEDELRIARTTAEAANRAKSNFLANMSHEIRTPMNGLFGMIQLLEMTELTQRQIDYITALRSSGKNLLLLINDILDLSKIEAGMITLEHADFTLKQCINDVVFMQKQVASEKGISLDVALDQEIPPVLRGDQLRIKQILNNLLGNAVKFTKRGAISVTAQILERHDDSVLVQMAVRDTGIGIPTEVLELIFSPFIQADDSTTRKYGGTGLGLTISRRLAELMQGSISVESTPDEGSCFRITLPLRAAPVTCVLPATKEQTANLWNAPPLRVLYVEDDQVNIAFGRSLLRKLGHDATVVENGEQCLALLDREQSYDLVLMDIQMPVMSGEEALREIRLRERGTPSHQRVIALTAYSLSGDKEGFLEAGFDGYLSKPLEAKELVREMKRVMAGELDC